MQTVKSVRLWTAAGVAAACLAVLLAPRSVRAQTYEVLHSFTFSDGAYPFAGLIRDTQGNLYGTTAYGGTGIATGGTVFKLSSTGEETVLYNFTGYSDGAYPHGGVILDAEGNLYGTTSNGGDLSCASEQGQGCGVIYKLSSTGEETVLYSFHGGTDDGANSYSGVIPDAEGNFYGTTYGGGESLCGSTYGCGVVFKLSTTGQETVLYTFCSKAGCADGANPYAGVIQDAQGNLYGTAQGASHTPETPGTVFKLNKRDKETVLYNFGDGVFPRGGLYPSNAKGNLYGTTCYGGAYSAGSVFMLSKTGKQIVLYSFTGGTDGGCPYAGVIRDAKGNLYGTTLYGGASSGGTVFKLSKAGKETVLYSFTRGSDGAYPYGGVIEDAAGNLYGTNTSGGDPSCGCGVVFELTP